MNIPLKRRLLLAIGVLSPIAVFFVARSTAIWRPHFIGVQKGLSTGGDLGGFLLLSPDERWLVSLGEYRENGTMWDLSSSSSKHSFTGSTVVFSPNSGFFASEIRTGVLQVGALGRKTSWTKNLASSRNEGLVSKQFSSDSQRIVCRTTHRLLEFDSTTGRIVKQTQATYTAPFSPWKSKVDYDGGSGVIVRQRISYFPKGARSAIFSFDVEGEDDDWNLAPDKLHLYYTNASRKRVQVLDARTGTKLWSYFSKTVDGTLFACYPQWEQGGQRLATIENDALIVRDSHTGKVLLDHKNNLPAPLQSWAFGKDENTVFLMDAKGEIFRQRLK